MPQNSPSPDEQVETAIANLLKASSDFAHITVFFKGVPSVVYEVYPYIEVLVEQWQEGQRHTGGRIEMEYTGAITVYGQWSHQASPQVTDRIGVSQSQQIVSRTLADIKRLLSNKRTLDDLSNPTEQWAVTYFELGPAQKLLRAIDINAFDTANRVEFMCRVLEVEGIS